MKPHINVTPLIDVLLVLLIIFMLVTPLQPGVIEARVPSNATDDRNVSQSDPMVVRINSDSTITINGISKSETVKDSQMLSVRIKELFASKSMAAGPGRSQERTVFVRAPQHFGYGEVIYVIDALKDAGADPIGLQINGLE